MTRRTRGAAFCSAFCAAFIAMLAGCRAASIPNEVSNREYALYAAWTNVTFANREPRPLFFRSHTTPFRPDAPNGCGGILHRKDGVLWSMLRQLDALGTAAYPLDLGPSGNHLFRISWPCQESDRLPAGAESGYRAITFSRVAFSRAGDEALFFFDDSCGGLCGGGGSVLARRKHGTWEFQWLHCVWVH